MKAWIQENIIFKHEGKPGEETVIVSAFLKETNEKVGWLVIPFEDQAVPGNSDLLETDNTKWRGDYIHVIDQYQRKGIGSSLIIYTEETFGITFISPSKFRLLPDGEALMRAMGKIK